MRLRSVAGVLLAICILIGSMTLGGCGKIENERYFEGEAKTYRNSLVAAGFPETYADALTELHLLHPNWRFVSLDVTATNADYTWNYVIEQETAEEDRNLIRSDREYTWYWDLSANAYRGATSRQASRAAVSYFMDPRNFLNETDIFQFFDLSAVDNVTVEAVEAVLAGTFMEDAVLENGKTYAQTFYDVGMEVGVYPVYLAVKARQEQGTSGNSPLITGNCGTTLWRFCVNGTQYTEDGSRINAPSASEVSRSALLSLDGYYNIFNIGASGDGVYEIYKNGMERAKTGSSSMRSEWGGDASWNTVWKSIMGGALFIKQTYVDRYQSTAYLQKFNVDGRSGRNFWGQYTQNVSDALSQSRILYQSFVENGALDGTYTFLIPVYRDMPSAVCHDPAYGSCSYLARATSKYSYTVTLSEPGDGESKSKPFYHSIEVDRGDSLSIVGNVKHDYGVSALEYSIDGSAWILASGNGDLNFSLPIGYAEDTTHILTIRGTAAYDSTTPAKKSNRNFLCAVFYITVT